MDKKTKIKWIKKMGWGVRLCQARLHWTKSWVGVWICLTLSGGLACEEGQGLGEGVEASCDLDGKVYWKWLFFLEKMNSNQSSLSGSVDSYNQGLQSWGRTADGQLVCSQSNSWLDPDIDSFKNAQWYKVDRSSGWNNDEIWTNGAHLTFSTVVAYEIVT